jgi:hypothetical protein
MNEARVAELLEELKDLMPEGHPHPLEQRKCSLTPSDLVMISEVIKRTSPQPVACALGLKPDECFSHEEIGILKHLVGWGVRGMALIGTLLVTAFFAVLAAIFGKGFWVWLKSHP